ncbi:MAG: SDR family NAD(P)-dependent oxidoreductase [Ardenticatenaceae bacterium]|nr:SDR family NAD(P)-dependent oxidoreductase [Anaerolineales bacterium]MCB8981682.1 SDR family NAD(P)-dependent oxidoreductase [Ardenticatenaceae bacterium]
MPKIAMIWGVSGGIGRAVAQELQANGWTVIGIGRHPEDAAHNCNYLFTADVAREYDVQTAVHAASFEVDQINLWIYAAGDIKTTAVVDFDLASWQRILDANLTGPFLTTKHSLPLLADDAHLVYLGAVSERLKLPKFSAYVAAKAGLEAFVGSLQKELRGKKITLVRPGAVATSFWDKLPIRLPKDAAPPEKVAKRILAAYDTGHSGQLDLV